MNEATSSKENVGNAMMMGTDNAKFDSSSHQAAPALRLERSTQRGFFEMHTFGTADVLEFLTARDLIMFLSTNKKIRNHHLAPGGEIPRRKKRFGDIKVEITQLLEEPSPTPSASMEAALALRTEAKNLIGFELLVHDVDVEQTTSNDDHYVCPHCSRDCFFYQKRIQLQAHSYHDIVEKGLMLPVEFYRIESDALIQPGAADEMVRENAINLWLQEFPTILPQISDAIDDLFPRPSSRFVVASTLDVPGRDLPTALPTVARHLIESRIVDAGPEACFSFRIAARRYARQAPEHIPVLHFLLVATDGRIQMTIVEQMAFEFFIQHLLENEEE